MWDDDFKRRVEVHFAEQRLFSILLIRGIHHVKEALDRLTASTNALIDQSAATDSELSAVVTEMQTLANAMSNSDDSSALTALADKIDASRGNSKAASDAASAALDALKGANTETAPAGGNANDSLNGGNGGDSLGGGASSQPGGVGNDTIDAGAGNDTVTAPVAVVSTAPEHTDGSGADTVIVTDHPNGDVLVTPVTSTGDVPAGAISVDPATGVPSSADEGVTLGETTVATDATTSAADLAASDPTTVVSDTPAA